MLAYVKITDKQPIGRLKVALLNIENKVLGHDETRPKKAIYVPSELADARMV